MSIRKKLFAVVVASTVVVLLTPGLSLAHQHRAVGRFETTVGWSTEPAFAGFQNAVSIRIEKSVKGADDDGHTVEADGHDHGEVVPVENASLKVEVIFGDRNGTDKTEPMDLGPAFGSPGEYKASIIPTRPGTYTFHIFGTVGSKQFDEYYTSGEAGANEQSEGTYHDIREPGDVQFPAKDPGAGALDARLDEVAATASTADDSASTATILAIIAIIVGALGGAAGVAVGRKK